MSDTRRKHLPTDRHAARAHTKRKLRERSDTKHKTAKQRRCNERVDLRRKYL